MRCFGKRWGCWVAVLVGLSLRLAWGQWIVDGRRFPEDPDAPGPGRTFPVLVLELGGPWTDFELKASVDNFETMVYFVKSSEVNGHADDADVWVYYTDDFAPDTRKWLKAEVATPIGGQLVDPVQSEVRRVVVMPSHGSAVDWAAWMFENNSKLVWSYVRFDGISLEMNAANTKSKWNVVVPVTWRAERFSP